MDFFSVLISVNKISILFFFITLGFLVYEFYLLRKEKEKGMKPSIPNFSDSIKMKTAGQPVVAKKEEKKLDFKRPNNIVIVVLILLVILFAGMSILSFLQSPVEPPPPSLQTTLPTPSVVVPTKPATNGFVSDDQTASVAAQGATVTPTPTLTETPSASAQPTSSYISITPTPTEVILAQTTGTIMPTEELSPSLEVTKIQKLPQTGFINNTLVLFAVASTFIFVAFIF